MTVNLDKNGAVYVGIDVHRYQHTAVAANRFEEELGQLTFANTPDGLASFLVWTNDLAPITAARIIGIEGANGNGKLLRETVVPLYSEVYEINPIFTKQRRTSGTRGDKSDPVDAKLIVEVLTRRLDQLPKITLQDSSGELKSLEELVVFHDDLVRQSSRLKNQLHVLFHQVDPSYRTCRSTAFSQKARKTWMRKVTKNQSSRQAIARTIIKEKLIQFDHIRKVRLRTDSQIEEILSQLYSHILTVPGVGLPTAAKILVAAKGIARFKGVDQWVKYAGIAPVSRSSGQTHRHVQARGGNRQLNNALYTTALTQLRWYPPAKVYFDKKVAEGKTKKHALRCLMKRAACIIYGVLKSDQPYREKVPVPKPVVN